MRSLADIVADIRSLTAAERSEGFHERLAIELDDYHRAVAKLPADDAYNTIFNQMIASTTLTWLFSSGLEAWRKLHSDRTMVPIVFMAGLLIAEGNEDLFWSKCRLVSQSAPWERYASQDDRGAVAWLGRFTGCLVRSHLLMDVSGSADRAIES